MSFLGNFSRLVAGYRDQGFEVTLHPTPDQLPEFARDYRVEILARSPDLGVMVAVRRTRLDLEEEVSRYAEEVPTHPGWRFDLAILEAVPPGVREYRGARELTGEEIARLVAEARALDAAGFSRPAVAVAWAALEASLRPQVRALGQPAKPGDAPTQALGEMYSSGLLMPDDFPVAKQAFRTRDFYIRGYAPPPDEAADPSALCRAVADLAERLNAAPLPLQQSA